MVLLTIARTIVAAAIDTAIAVDAIEAGVSINHGANWILCDPALHGAGRNFVSFVKLNGLGSLGGGSTTDANSLGIGLSGGKIPSSIRVGTL